MKNSSLGTKLLTAGICLTVLVYFGIQIVHYFSDPLRMVQIYDYQVEESTAVSGWLIRDERVLDGSGGGELRLSRAEGERVPAGGEIAVVYSDAASLQNQSEIDAAQTRLEQLQYARQAAESGEVALKLDSQIAEDIRALRGCLASDSLAAADSVVSELRSLVLKRDYTYAGSDASDEITELESQLKTLRAKAAAASRVIRSPASGIYSAVVDGYEKVLTPAVVDSLKPSDLTAVQKDGALSSDTGKLILGDTWYFAASLSAPDAAELKEGGTVTLRFAKGAERDLRVTVRSISDQENGRTAVVFAGTKYLPELTLLRQQSADIIRNAQEGLRAPQEALRVDENGQTGLYCLVGMTARFKPVTVLYRGEDFVLVQADSQQESTRLRAGDQVIITSGELYDGKVISEAVK